MEYIFWGHNIPLAAHLRETLQCKIIECITFQQIKSCLSSIEYIDFCVFMERSDMATDIPTIAQLHKLYPTLYIILISETLSKEEKIPYLRAGTDCMISKNTSKDDLQKLFSVIIDFKEKEKARKDNQISSLTEFRLPLWKRTFDILASGSAILCLSPILILTALAIRTESNGKIVYKSKRVGSNYKIFDFYKFRSMYSDADKRLAEYQQLNQYTKNIAEEEFKDSSSAAEISQQSCSSEQKQEQEQDILLFSDNLSTSENNYLKTKRTERSNAFFKLENDPRITRVGHFIRKYSIDELPLIVTFSIISILCIIGSALLSFKFKNDLKKSSKFIKESLIVYSDDKTLLKIEKDNFNNELGRIEKTIDESIHNAAYSEINLYYNHYNSSTSFEFKKLNLFPLKFEGEYYSNKDFVIETDITSMIYSLLTFYIMYQLRMCECISRAAENTIRNQITREAIDKIKDRHRMRMLIKCLYDDRIHDLLQDSLSEFYKMKTISARVAIELNPNNML